MRGGLDVNFHLAERGVTPFSEFLAGLTTFATMCYVIFVQPAVLSAAGMDFGAVMAATCVSAAFGSILMGLLANLPIAQAPGMGQNFFFAYTVCGATAVGGYGMSWREGLAAVFLSGVLFLAFSLAGMRDKFLRLMPESIKLAIASGIGLLIALIGFEWGGVVVASPGTLLRLGPIAKGPALMVMTGVAVTALLTARRVRGAILLGIGFCTVWGLTTGYASWHGIVSLPPSIGPAFLKLDVVGAFKSRFIFASVLTFFILVLFDSIGTITALAHQAGLVKDGQIPNGRRALVADATATIFGALSGTSTVTSYVESSAGVGAGGRTGLSAVVTGLLFLLALFAYPLVRMVGGGYEIEPGHRLYPVIAPALITVGSLLAPLAAGVEWKKPEEATPAFLTMVVMPFTFSITEGISAGLISYSVLHTGIGGGPKTHPVVHLLAALFILRYIFLF